MGDLIPRVRRALSRPSAHLFIVRSAGPRQPDRRAHERQRPAGVPDGAPPGGRRHAAAAEDEPIRLQNLDARFPPREFEISHSIAPFADGDWGNYAKAAAQALAVVTRSAAGRRSRPRRRARRGRTRLVVGAPRRLRARHPRRERDRARPDRAHGSLRARRALRRHPERRHGPGDLLRRAARQRRAHRVRPAAPEADADPSGLALRRREHVRRGEEVGCRAGRLQRARRGMPGGALADRTRRAGFRGPAREDARRARARARGRAAREAPPPCGTS